MTRGFLTGLPDGVSWQGLLENLFLAPFQMGFVSWRTFFLEENGSPNLSKKNFMRASPFKCGRIILPDFKEIENTGC